MTRAIQVLFLSLIFPLSGFAIERGLAENQIKICDSDLKEVLGKLQLSKKPDKTRYTGFFETRHLDLYDRQFFVRIRRSKNKVVMTFKKNAPSVELWQDPRLECETDIHESYSKQSCSYDVRLSSNAFEDLKKQPQNWSRILSPEQRSIFTKMSEGFDFSVLQFWGEVPSLKWEWDQGAQILVLDVWLMPPQGAPMIEVSTRSELKDSASMYEGLKKYILNRGLSFCDLPEGRTLTVLKYFTGQ